MLWFRISAYQPENRREVDDIQIGELACRTGASLRSLRYYEAKGLLSTQRKQNRYRSYQEEDVDRVLEIQQYLSTGLTTGQIYHIILRSDGNAAFPLLESQVDCPGAIAFYEQKLQEIEQRMASLNRAKAKFQEILIELQQNTRDISTLHQISLIP